MKKILTIVVLITFASVTAYALTLAEKPTEKTKIKKDTSVQQEPSQDPAPVAEFDKSKLSKTDAVSMWVVVNKRSPLQPKSYKPADLTVPAVAVRGTQYLRNEAATATSEMFLAAKSAGLSLRVESAYRSYNTQVAVYGNEVKTYGQTVADTQSARPGHSEHQTGLAADFGAASGKCSIADCFAHMSEGKWLAANAHKYGFILRYPENKSSITGYRYEPWHYRYVGKELALEMNSKNVLTLEEFFGLRAAPNYN